MRAVEGEKLRTDVLNRLAAVETLVAQIEQNSAGLVLDIRDVSGSAKRLVQWLGDPQNAARAGEAARELARERFSRELLARKLEILLKNSVEESS